MNKIKTGLKTSDKIEVIYNGRKAVMTVGEFNLQSKPYKSYVALMSQSGTNVPTAVVLENTLGGIPTLDRAQVGAYRLDLTGVFTENKTFLIIGSPLDREVSAITWVSEDRVAIFTKEQGVGLVDDLLDKTSVEIRVYD